MSNNGRVDERIRTRGHSIGLGQILRMKSFLHSWHIRTLLGGKNFPNIVIWPRKRRRIIYVDYYSANALHTYRIEPIESEYIIIWKTCNLSGKTLVTKKVWKYSIPEVQIYTPKCTHVQFSQQSDRQIFQDRADGRTSHTVHAIRLASYRSCTKNHRA